MDTVGHIHCLDHYLCVSWGSEGVWAGDWETAAASPRPVVVEKEASEPLVAAVTGRSDSGALRVVETEERVRAGSSRPSPEICRAVEFSWNETRRGRLYGEETAAGAVPGPESECWAS